LQFHAEAVLTKPDTDVEEMEVGMAIEISVTKISIATKKTPSNLSGFKTQTKIYK